MSTQVSILPHDDDDAPSVRLSRHPGLNTIPIIEFSPGQYLNLGSLTDPAGWLRDLAGELLDLADECDQVAAESRAAEVVAS